MTGGDTNSRYKRVEGMAAVDLAPFKLDIDELLNDFIDNESTSLADLKEIWRARKFSFIYDSSPKTNLPFSMQSLYAHCISYMVSTGSISRRLGGLYCLYCLYETQPFKPPFKIYLSIRELKMLKNLAVDAIQNEIQVGAALIKQMLERNIFLFGIVELDNTKIAARVIEITKLQTTGVQLAYKKLLANTKIEDYLHLDLSTELHLEGLKKFSAEYAKTKEVSIKEAGEVVGIDDIKHIAEPTKLIGDAVEEISKEWDAQKEEFYRKTGMKCPDEAEAEELELMLLED